MSNTAARAPWNPEQYAVFTNERARPADDLMARIPLELADRILDLGCGAGAQAADLAKRFPMAYVLGIDSSPDMLAKARATFGQTDALQWMEADIDVYEPDAGVDLV